MNPPTSNLSQSDGDIPGQSVKSDLQDLSGLGSEQPVEEGSVLGNRNSQRSLLECLLTPVIQMTKVAGDEEVKVA
jgi:hypothetical protein